MGRPGIAAAALILVLGTMAASSLRALDLSVVEVRGQRILRATGPIQPGDAENVRHVLTNSGRLDEIWLHSGGGDVNEGYAIGRLIRSGGYATRVPEACYSACVDVFIGGVIRQVDPGAEVKIHMGSISGDDDVVRQTERSVERGTTRKFITQIEQQGARDTADWHRYLLEMAVSVKMIAKAVEVPHAEGYTIPYRELRMWNIVNFD